MHGLIDIFSPNAYIYSPMQARWTSCSCRGSLLLSLWEFHIILLWCNTRRALIFFFCHVCLSHIFQILWNSRSSRIKKLEESGFSYSAKRRVVVNKVVASYVSVWYELYGCTFVAVLYYVLIVIDVIILAVICEIQRDLGSA